MTDDQQKPPHSILFVLPTHFASRNILTSDLPGILAQRQDIQVTFASLYPEDQEKVEAFHNPRFTWHHLKYPLPGSSLVRPRTVVYWFQSFVYTLAQLLLLNRARHQSLVYRFNELKGFFGHRLRKNMASWQHGSPVNFFKFMAERKKNHFNAQRYGDPMLGWPFPQSRAAYDFLKKCYCWSWGNKARVETFFDLNAFDTVVINFIQTPRVFPYVNAAKRRGIPIIGMVGSWDNPTLKGPVFPGLGTYLVQNRYMAEQLSRHHEIEAERIIITGWPQMDIYKKDDVLLGKEEFLASLGLDRNKQLILFGANTSRLGQHEISILKYMTKQVEDGRYGRNTVLIIRPHPGDSHWQKRFKDLMGRENILIEEPSYTDRIHFANLVKNADIVISSAGTISLDAVAFDTCTINIAFDGDLELPSEKSVRMFYKLEHYASIVETGGTILVGSYDELDRCLLRFLHSPEANSADRRRLRYYHLEPFDGLASQRIANVIFNVISRPKDRGPSTS